jgi:hypothetical protein
VIQDEVPQIRAACTKASGGRQYQPHLTLLVLQVIEIFFSLIVLQKRGNQRVMLPPELLATRRGARAPDQNVPSGTCIDAGTAPIFILHISKIKILSLNAALVEMGGGF